MKNSAVVLAVVVLCALAQAGQGADLQAGWYATMYSVQFYGYDPQHHYPVLAGSGSFTTIGTYGPFVVTDDPYHWERSRQATVPSYQPDVDSSSSLSLPVSSELIADLQLAYVHFGWETNYDPTQILLELWHATGDGTLEKVWQQDRAGAQSGFSSAAYDTSYGDGFYFRVAVLPEPSTCCAMLGGLSGYLLCLRRRYQW